MPDTPPPMTQVVNVRTHPGPWVYCGRRMPRDRRPALRHGSPWGNPFRGPGAIERFAAWFHEQAAAHEDFRQLTLALRGLPLGCWCYPAACHCDVIADWLDVQPAPGPRPLRVEASAGGGRWVQYGVAGPCSPELLALFVQLQGDGLDWRVAPLPDCGPALSQAVPDRTT